MQLYKGARSGSFPFLSLNKQLSLQEILEEDLKRHTLSLGSPRETLLGQLPQALSMVSVAL